MPDKIVNHFVLADGSTAKYSAEQLAGDVPEVVDIRTGYDGTEYASAGDAVREQISDIQNVFENSNLYYNYDFTNASDGHYIDVQGHYLENSSYSISDVIQVKKGQNIVFNARGYSTNVAMISRVENGVYIPLTISVDSTVRVYTYQVPYDIEIVLCYSTASAHECNIYYNISEIAESATNNNEIYTIDLSNSINGKYVYKTGAVANDENYAISQPFFVCKGDSLQITAGGYLDYVAILAYYDGNTYTPVVTSQDGVTDYAYTATKSGYVVMSYSINKRRSCVLTHNNSTVEIEKEVAILKDEKPNYLFLFHKIGGIGDSLMSGELVPKETNRKDAYAYSWLSNLAKYAVGECVHYSAGGMTAKSWINDSGGYKTALENETIPCDAYFIALGTNDRNQSVYPIGSISDVAGSDTFVGYYKEIIDIVHTKNPNAYIFCLSQYTSIEASLPYSDIVEDISDLYSYCYYVNFAGNTKHTTKETSDYAENSHFTSVGYLYASMIIKDLVESIIANNKADFKWIGFD